MLPSFHLRDSTPALLTLFSLQISSYISWSHESFWWFMNSSSCKVHPFPSISDSHLSPSGTWMSNARLPMISMLFLLLCPLPEMPCPQTTSQLLLFKTHLCCPQSPPQCPFQLDWASSHWTHSKLNWASSPLVLFCPHYYPTVLRALTIMFSVLNLFCLSFLSISVLWSPSHPLQSHS
jgi:hypothetical protein